MRITVACLVVLTLALSMHGLEGPVAVAAEKDTVTIALTGEPPTMDPHRVSNFIGAMVLGGIFLWYAIRMQSGKDDRVAIKTFGYSIIYLMLLFTVLLVDHYIK